MSRRGKDETLGSYTFTLRVKVTELGQLYDCLNKKLIYGTARGTIFNTLLREFLDAEKARGNVRDMSIEEAAQVLLRNDIEVLSGRSGRRVVAALARDTEARERKSMLFQREAASKLEDNEGKSMEELIGMSEEELLDAVEKGGEIKNSGATSTEALATYRRQQDASKSAELGTEENPASLNEPLRGEEMSLEDIKRAQTDAKEKGE